MSSCLATTRKTNINKRIKKKKKSQITTTPTLKKMIIYEMATINGIVNSNSFYKTNSQKYLCNKDLN